MAIGLYHGNWIVGATDVSYNLPIATVETDVMADSIVALHFNRTGQFLFLIRATDLTLYDNATTMLAKLPDYDDTRLVKDLTADEKTKAQIFLNAIGITLTATQSQRLNNMAWNAALRVFVKRTIAPVVDLDLIKQWIQEDRAIHYVDIPNKGEDV